MLSALTSANRPVRSRNETSTSSSATPSGSSRSSGYDASTSIGRVCALRARRHGSGRKGRAGGGAAPCRGAVAVGSGSTPVDASREAKSNESSAARSHTRMSLSDEAVTRTHKSGMTWTALTKSRWPTVVERSAFVCGSGGGGQGGGSCQRQLKKSPLARERTWTSQTLKLLSHDPLMRTSRVLPPPRGTA